MAEAHHLKPTESNPHPPITASRRAEYRIRSGVILTRAPLITRALTPFENAFFFYQKRLNERLVLPFRHTFYFKKDTAADLDWRIKFEERGSIAAKELGRYYAQGRNAWNDELLVGSTLSNEERIREILLKDAELRVTEDGEEAPPDEIVPVERPMDRVTEADKKNDIRRLDRALDRTLYLIVQRTDGYWQFPTEDVPTDENLHEVSQRRFSTQCNKLKANQSTDCREGPGTGSRRQHEYMDGRTGPRSPPRQATRVQRRHVTEATRRKDILPQRQNYGWPGRSER